MLAVHINWCKTDNEHSIKDQSDILNKLTDYVSRYYPAKDTRIQTGPDYYDIIIPFGDDHNTAMLNAIGIALNVGVAESDIISLYINHWCVYDCIKFEVIHKDIMYFNMDISIYFNSDNRKLKIDIGYFIIETNKIHVNICGYFTTNEVKDYICNKFSEAFAFENIVNLNSYIDQINELIDSVCLYGVTRDKYLLKHSYEEVGRSAIRSIEVSFYDE